MAVTADISSSFIIRATQSAAAAETVTITNPGRAFTIQTITIKWIALESVVSNSTVQIAQVTAAGAVNNLFGNAIQGSRTVVPVWQNDASAENVTPLHPSGSNALSATDNVRITSVGAATQVEVILYCIGNPSQSLTVS